MKNKWEEVSILDVAPITSKLVDPKGEKYSSMILIAPDHIQSESGQIIAKVTSREQNAISGKYLVKKGDVIYSKIRPYLKKVCIAPDDCLCSADMYPFSCTEKINSKYLQTILLSKQFTDYANSCSARTGIPKINRDDIALFFCKIPPILEQEKISETLSIWDSAIEKTEKLIEKKESLFNWYAKRILVSGKTSKGLFSDLFKLSSEKNTLNQNYPALSVTKDGVVFQEEYFNKRVASEDTSSYLIARRNTFVFSGLNFWMGSVDLQTLTDVGIISPAYKVFTINSDLISYEYAHFLIRSNYMKRLLMDSSIVGASIVRRNLDMDNLLNSAIELPTLEQQSKIVEQLSLIQKDIELNKKLLKQYKLQKQGLMQKLLTGEWRIK
jgi:type I restriction enzyme S subunit